LEVRALVAAERAGDVFPDCKAGLLPIGGLPHFLYDPHRLHKKAAAGFALVAEVIVL
jgi:hypothetical protein